MTAVHHAAEWQADDRAWLMALAPLPDRGWVGTLGDRLRSAGMHTAFERRSLIVWKNKVGEAADAVVLERVWLAPRKWALGVFSRRIHFTPDGSLDRRAERELSPPDTRSRRPAEALLSLQLEVLDLARKGLPGSLHPVELTPVEFEKAQVIEIRNRAHALNTSFDNVYKQHGFDQVPDGWMVTVIPLDGAGLDDAAVVASHVKRAADARQACVDVATMEVERLEGHLAGAAESVPIHRERVMLFLLPSKVRDVTSRSLELLGRLDELGIRYRRCYVDDDVRVAIPDQLPSLLQAAGGAPHAVNVRAGIRPVWSIGIDLAHGSGASRSRLAATLVDPRGALVESWIAEQRKDETANPVQLERILFHASGLVRELGSPGEVVLVLRDGRLFENESPRTYLEALGKDTSLLEIRKGRNPQVFTKSGLPTAPCAFLVPDSNTIFVRPAPPRTSQGMPRVLKTSWQSAWNGLSLSPADVAQVLTQLALAPALGTHRIGLPVPIYWADGLAGASERDLRFRGNAPTFIEAPGALRL